MIGIVIYTHSKVHSSKVLKKALISPGQGSKFSRPLGNVGLDNLGLLSSVCKI